MIDQLESIIDDLIWVRIRFEILEFRATYDDRFEPCLRVHHQVNAEVSYLHMTLSLSTED